MSIACLILGESGSGKSASLRNLNPEKTLLIQTISKPLPFRAAGWKAVVTDRWDRILNGIKKAKGMGKEIVVIDDFQYMMANEYMNRSMERGYDKFTDIGNHAWQVFMGAAQADDDIRVYIMGHTQTDDSGITKAKTIGRMLDEKIVVEGMFSIVLRNIIDGGDHFFTTRNSGADTVKTPIGLFPDGRISNDLAEVDRAICEYYKINQQEKSE